MKILNQDCIEGAKSISDNSVDLVICDPPFGIGEGEFGNDIYIRPQNVILDGYVEAPENYYQFTIEWLEQAKRILKPDGTIYIISGWNKLFEVLGAVRKLKLQNLNHIIWKYRFGVFTTKKFTTSHYHILRLGKQKYPKFNPHCRFGPQERDNNGKNSALNNDMEDVFQINKEYHQGDATKNRNKLPDELIQKLILYSSNPGDMVCDFFMGNFTTAYVSLRLGRQVCGFELNKKSFDHHLPILQEISFGCGLSELKKVEIIRPKNFGKPISKEESSKIISRYKELIQNKEKHVIKVLCNEFGRGRFGIKAVLKKRNH